MKKHLLLTYFIFCIIFLPAITIAVTDNITGSDYIRTGETIFDLTNGDYVLPKFSPNGKYFAYSEVINDSTYETTQVLLLNLKSHAIDTILKSNIANKYATYKSFVTGIDWSADNKILFVTLHDGDVSSSTVKINITTHKIESSKATLEYRPLSVSENRILAKLINLYPEINNEAFENTFKNLSYLYVPDNGIILQNNYVSEDHNIWYLNTKINKKQTLISLLPNEYYSFGSGAIYNKSAVFVVKKDSLAKLYTFVDDSLKYLTGFLTTLQTPTILVKGTSSNYVYYNLVTAEPYEKSNNPVFCFNGVINKQLIDFQYIYDFDVNFTNKLIALCHWEKGKRYITIKHLLDN